MATDLEGRALHEAAARAMGWIPDGDQWHDEDGTWMADEYGPNERQMLAWLHERRDCIILGCYVGKVSACAASVVAKNIHTEGRDLREALARLVVAVAAREAKQA